ncbi:hypothetical protein N7456_000127 [Penicillium angulare]|uniref:Uncharacterized protein n=1 Tax=Penicillium angulare TaxID=116970 RepID=A0A9W9GBK0_9EURO|nr:hypothetical protein N7456_000127 [Penicillium angulare]
MTKGLKSLLTPWTSQFTNLQQELANVSTIFDNLDKATSQIQDQLKDLDRDIGADVSQQTMETLDKFNKKVSDLLSFQKELAQFKLTAGQITATINQMTDLVNTVIDAASAPMTVDALIQMAMRGDLKDIADIVKLLKVATDLPDLIRQLQSSLPSVADFITNFGQKSQQIRDALAEILAQDISGLEAKAKARVSSIQALFQGQVVSVVDKISATFSTASKLLTTLPIGRGGVSVDIKVASYQRWSFISMDMPCLRTDHLKFRLGGFTRSVPYPEFYRCPYSEKIPWPNHHIPYIAIKFT